MSEDQVATSSIMIDASPDRVWEVLTDPDAVREFMFGTTVVTDWTVGAPIRWQGEWEGRAYEDKGVILEAEPGRRLVCTHFSPLTGKPDIPENYHTLTWTIAGDGPVEFTLSQDNNPDEAAALHSKRMWDSLVRAMKDIAERQG
ncbi:SRPBCC domain-containing protein [Microbacterium sp. 2MCAF23]|uniref:SRPBCC domain-containing protein n=1 Tax=Microbacterium sp. 2MCAF23 TaxID=3232985 RepID=UPI003F995C2E